MAFIIGTSTANTQILAAGTTAERPATPSAGQMRFNSTTGGFEVYAGTSWANMGSPTLNGSTEALAAPSARHIKNINPSATNGIYWIKPGGSYTGSAYQLYCDMTGDGGGWVLAFAYHKGQSPQSSANNYYTSPQAAATAASQSLSAVATPQDPAQSYCLPANFWQAFGTDQNGLGEIREEIGISGGTWPNNSSRVLLYLGGRNSSGGTGNYLTASQLAQARLVYGYTDRASTNYGYWGSIARGGYTSNTLGLETRYTGAGNSSILGIQVDASNLNTDRTGSTGTNTNAASGYSWMGRGNCCGMGAGSANGSEPNGTMWGLTWIR